MTRQFSRREFLKFSALSSLSVLTAIVASDTNRKRHDPVTGIELDSDDETLSYEELMQFSLKLARAGQILKLSTWRPPLTAETLLAWSQEVSLQMQAEGIVDKPPVPQELTFFEPKSGDQANHYLAYTDCETYIRLSQRFRNQLTDWHNSPDWLAAVAHELVHLGAQQTELCKDAPSEQLEAAASIGALIVLAAMANRGNGIAMKAFVWEFLDDCMGAALLVATTGNRLSEYDRLRKIIYPGILSASRAEKLNREYEDKLTDRLEILRKYYLLPIEIIMRSHLNNNDRVEGLILQPKAIYAPWGQPISYEDRVLDLRDWSWIMSHLQEMSQAFAALPTNSIIR